MKAIGFDGIDYLAAITSTPGSVPAIAAAMNPQGHITFIDNFDESILPFKAKSITISWEMMFTRSLFQTKNMDAQHRKRKSVRQVGPGRVLTGTASGLLWSVLRLVPIAQTPAKLLACSPQAFTGRCRSALSICAKIRPSTCRDRMLSITAACPSKSLPSLAIVISYPPRETTS